MSPLQNLQYFSSRISQENKDAPRVELVSGWNTTFAHVMAVLLSPLLTSFTLNLLPPFFAPISCSRFSSSLRYSGLFPYSNRIFLQSFYVQPFVFDFGHLLLNANYRLQTPTVDTTLTLIQDVAMEHASADGHYDQHVLSDDLDVDSIHLTVDLLIILAHPTISSNAHPTPTTNTTRQGQSTICNPRHQRPPTRRPRLGPRLPSPLSPAPISRNAIHSGAVCSVGVIVDVMHQFFSSILLSRVWVFIAYTSPLPSALPVILVDNI
ncbi:hypothetical protein F4604DRAFT_1912879 [Suillus subluteus]|nr:hypothetical protein F4604DRAFT_1912879 [Suillus subluteus]